MNPHTKKAPAVCTGQGPEIHKGTTNMEHVTSTITDQDLENPVGVLRAAAEKALSLAQAATPGPWVAEMIGHGEDYDCAQIHAGHGATVVDRMPRIADARHAAAWNPAVAVAVAELWLSVAASLGDGCAVFSPTALDALRAARAFLPHHHRHHEHCGVAEPHEIEVI